MGELRAAIRVVVLMVAMGWVLIWIMVPTNTYKQNWLPKIRKTSYYSTYFGDEGTTFLIYTFPVLFIAVLGCLYIHLERKCKSHNTASKGKNIHHLSLWQQPLLVKGPLGIVSWIEVGFLGMFIALLAWSFATYLENSFATITQKTAAMYGEKVWESKLANAGLRLGLVGNICLTFLFFPVTRGSSVLPLLGLTSESSIKYHIWLGHLVMSLFTAHGLCYIVTWAATSQLSEMLQWAKTDISVVAGEVSLVAGVLMWATTFSRIRRKFFELFFYTHYLYIIFVVFFVFHVGISYVCIMLPGFYLFLIDRFLRFLQSRRRVRLLSARLLPCQALELNFAKNPGLKYNPTSTMFINIPSISKLQWHPFTITSSTNLEPNNLSIMIKSEGTWSTTLYQTLSSSPPLDRLEVAIEGPYGPISSHLLGREALVMVSGGSGITPFISIIRDLVYSSTALNPNQTPKILLISAFKNASDLTMLDLLVPVSGSPAAFSGLQLQIEAYVTREKAPKPEEPSSNLQIRTIFFKPYPTNAPISAILGPNTWLWLAAIICSSFVLFLILIGVITRYYIYPIDHNTGDVFSMSLRAFLNMVVICVCIATAGSGAVLWNKKRLSKEDGQIQNVEMGATPAGSPTPASFNPEREVESVPQQSIAQCINVHYGERPELKRILLECKGENVGVLVSGPRKMRQEVAAVCSSGLVDNLHFESISFSW